MEAQSNSLEIILEEFDTDIDAACEFASEYGARTALQDLPSYDALVGEQAEMMDALQRKLGFNFHNKNARPLKQYAIEGTPGAEGEGTIMVSVFETKVPGVYVGKYERADGDVIWTIRALDVEE